MQPAATELLQGVASSVRYLEVKMYGVARLGPRKLSAVRSLEVVTSRRLPMYYINEIFNP